MKFHKVILTTGIGLLLLLRFTHFALPNNTTFKPKDTIVVGGVTFVRIPAGTFAMGDNSSQASPNEKPVHTVTLNSFWMASTEITLTQWKAFIDQANYAMGRSQADGPTHPVVSVTWEDTEAYCRWFSKEYGVTMRLPTEAEWEYAARGGLEGKQFPNGDTMTPRHANYDSGGAMPVAKFPPNAYGLYDMAGNVSEWVGDWYEKNFYSVSPGTNPRGPITETGKVQRRADRGGGWCMGLERLRVAARHAGPGSWDKGGTADCLGFRPILEGSVRGR